LIFNVSDADQTAPQTGDYKLKVVHSTLHKTDNFKDGCPNQFLGMVLKKLNPTQKQNKTKTE